MKKIIKIAVGAQHCIMIDNKYQVHFFGKNNFGQFGLNNDVQNNDIYRPTIHEYFIKNKIKINNIDTQVHTPLYIDINGNVYTSGFNIFGNIGNGQTNVKHNKIYKLKLENDEYIVDKTCGVFHTLLLNQRNELITFGKNNFNQCSKLKEEQKVVWPYKVSKKTELNIAENDFIDRVVAGLDFSIIVINPYKTKKNK